jgi:hypothetical protein
MYGWVEKWLGGRGDGSAVAEPEIKIEEIAAIRCFADGASRPKTIVTIPEFAWREGRARLAALPRNPDHVQHWYAEAERMRAVLRDQILGGFPSRTPLTLSRSGAPEKATIAFTSERDVRLSSVLERGPGDREGTVLLIGCRTKADQHPTKSDPARIDEIKRPWHAAGFSTVELNCRTVPEIFPVGGVADHTAAEWALWVGRPLLGQWVYDIVRGLDSLDEMRHEPRTRGAAFGPPVRPYVLIGQGAMSLPTLLAAALDPRVAAVSCSGGLVSFVARTARPWTGVPMGWIAPNILDAGDVGHLAALVAPRPLAFTRAIEPDGGIADHDRTVAAFAFSRAIYALMGAADRLKLSQPADLRALLPQP